MRANFRLIYEDEIKQGELPLNTFITGDALRVLKKLPSNSVDLVITSPPYYAKRDYEHPDQIGLESTFEEYIEKLVRVFKEVYRILKPTGSVYLNIDDTYWGGGHGAGTIYKTDKGVFKDVKYGEGRNYCPVVKWSGKYKKKCMCLIPFRLLIRLVDEVGFVCRNVIIWHKTSAMPESVKNRFSHRYEFIFFLVKDEDEYYFNLDLVREPYKDSSLRRIRYYIEKLIREGKTIDDINKYRQIKLDELNKLFSVAGVVTVRSIKKILDLALTWYRAHRVNAELSQIALGKRQQLSITAKEAYVEHKDRLESYVKVNGTVVKDEVKDLTNITIDLLKLLGKNPGDVWEFTAGKTKEAHFSVFPIELPLRCILASCPPDGVVLDPFSGIGTVAQVCVMLNLKKFDLLQRKCSFPISELVKKIDWNLKFIMIDIKKEYHEIAIRKINEIISE